MEAVLGPDCAMISAVYDHYEFPSTREELTKLASMDIVFMMFM